MRLSRTLGLGLGFYLGGPAGALIGYLIGKAIGIRTSHPPVNTLLARHYNTLKVPPNASTEEIKRSYRVLVKKYHPDLQGQADEEKASLLKKRMAGINEAYREIRKVRHF